MTSAQICIMIAITVYLMAMVAIGIYWSKKNENVGDFYLGGRKLGPFVTAMSAEASDMSSWLLMGLPGVAYLSGIADPAWTAIGLAIGTYINWLVVAKRIRIYTHESNNSITLPDFFSRRYRDDKNILMCIAAVVIIIFFIPYTASGFAACGKLFSSLLGVDYQTAMIISAIVIVGYTATGGFSAASTTDLVQSIVMTIALFVVVIFGIQVAGGLDVVVGAVPVLEGSASETIIVRVADLLSHSGIATAFLAGIILAGILAATMSTADSQLLAASSSASHNLLQGFFGIKMSEKKAMNIARCSVVIISIIAAFIARDPASSVFAIVSFAWAGFGAAFGPVVLSALFWRRSNKQGALAGMIAGGAMVFIWKYMVRPLGGAWNIYELLPAFVVSFAAIIIVSLLTKAPEREITDEFDRVNMLCKKNGK